MADLIKPLKKARVDLDRAIQFVTCAKLAVKSLDDGDGAIVIEMTLEAACRAIAECDDPVADAIRVLEARGE